MNSVESYALHLSTNLVPSKISVPLCFRTSSSVCTLFYKTYSIRIEQRFLTTRWSGASNWRLTNRKTVDLTCRFGARTANNEHSFEGIGRIR